MSFSLVAPATDSPSLDRLLDRLRQPSLRLRPFDRRIIDFCAQFSTVLFRDHEARVHPEIQALAYWMRRSELLRMAEEFSRLKRDDVVLAPRGLVFHIAPSNVDTIFVYSWMLSVLTGNTNILRISERASPVSELLCRLFSAALENADATLAQNTAILRYGHDREITAAISAVADVRVIWGGDRTVETVRAFPLPPHAKELTFPNRSSLTVLSSSTYRALSDEARGSIATQFYNDTFWFDQMACSSPRMVIWVGKSDDCEEASRAFYEALQTEISVKGYTLPVGPRLNKLTFAYRAVLDKGVSKLVQAGPECTFLKLENLEQLSDDHCGGGLLFEAHIAALADIGRVIRRRDQTVTHFGFTIEEIRELAVRLNGRGVDRFVPLGKALSFGRIWDGYDLLQELVRAVYIEA